MTADVDDTIRPSVWRIGTNPDPAPPALEHEFWIFTKVSEDDDYGVVVPPEFADPDWTSGNFVVDDLGSSALFLQVHAMIVDRDAVSPFTLNSSSLDTAFNDIVILTSDPDAIFSGAILFTNGIGLIEVNQSGTFPAMAVLNPDPVPNVGVTFTKSSMWAYDGLAYEYFIAT